MTGATSEPAIPVNRNGRKRLLSIPAGKYLLLAASKIDSIFNQRKYVIRVTRVKVISLFARCRTADQIRPPFPILTFSLVLLETLLRVVRSLNLIIAGPRDVQKRNRFLLTGPTCCMTA